MSNPVKYIKDLEAAGFGRAQAEAQVQMVLDAIQGELMRKNDFALFREHMDRKFLQVEHQMIALELRLLVKLGFLVLSTTSLAVAVLTWLIKL